ncbi:MAG TPA: hypothetical protein VMQ17_20180 [Candidatus Sulfotelmatobacter sp.]|nr:hypothetical protein [Candidatus Sulfotelmatobacter sp.]
MKLDVNRREFLKITAGAGATLAVPTSGHTAVSSKMIGIQVGAVSFVDEGTERVLDVLQERASVNTLFLAVFSYGRGIAGRQIPGQPLPDHGKQEYDLNFHGGNFAAPHPQYYKNTVLNGTRAPDHGDLDILAEVLPAAQKRGIKVICWLEDVFRTDLPGIAEVQERDLYGRNAETLPSMMLPALAWDRRMRATSASKPILIWSMGTLTSMCVTASFLATPTNYHSERTRRSEETLLAFGTRSSAIGRLRAS